MRLVVKRTINFSVDVQKYDFLHLSKLHGQKTHKLVLEGIPRFKAISAAQLHPYAGSKPIKVLKY